MSNVFLENKRKKEIIDEIEKNLYFYTKEENFVFFINSDKVDLSSFKKIIIEKENGKIVFEKENENFSIKLLAQIKEDIKKFDYFYFWILNKDDKTIENVKKMAIRID